MSMVIIVTRCLTAICLLNFFATCIQVQQKGLLESIEKHQKREERELNSTLEVQASETSSSPPDATTKFLLQNVANSESPQSQINNSLNSNHIEEDNGDTINLNSDLFATHSLLYATLKNRLELISKSFFPNSDIENSSTPSLDISSKSQNSSNLNGTWENKKVSRIVDTLSKISKDGSDITQFSDLLDENITSLPILHIIPVTKHLNITSEISLPKSEQNKSNYDNLDPNSKVKSSNSNYELTTSTSTIKPFPEMLPTPLPFFNDQVKHFGNQARLNLKENKSITTTTTTQSYTRLWQSSSQTKLPILNYNPPVKFLSRSLIKPFRGMSSFHSPDDHLHQSSFLMTSTAPTIFDSNSPKNISAQMGSSVYIPCKIKNLGNKTVSWIRNRDSHILTVGRYIFIADARFDSWHEEDTDTWILLIKYVQDRDKGFYECQVSTEPKMSHFVYFNVVSPLVTIPGGSDIHVKVGSTVSIKCFITNALKQPQYIFWYKGKERVVDERTSRSKIFLERITNDTSVGTLVLPNASPSDAGLYQCVPEKLKTANVTLHVINGEHPAAMQHGTSVMIGPGSPVLLILSLILSMFLQIFAHVTLFST